MKRLLLLASLVLLTACQSSTPVINFHESVEQMSDVSKLLSVMEAKGIETTVLQGIPSDLLQYTEGEKVDLSGVVANHALLAEATKGANNLKWVCAINPNQSDWASILDACLEGGAVGVKTYLGYSYGHEAFLDDPSFKDFYDRLEQEGLFLVMPVNLSLYRSEFENVLSLHPNLQVIAPHYALSLGDLKTLREVMDAHPMLSLDTSFGHLDYVKTGFDLMTQNHEDIRQFMMDYQDRILFGTDNVMTTYEDKEAAWFEALYADYLGFFTESEKFTSQLDPQKEYQGLDLPKSVQKKVLFQNAKALLQ